MNIKLFLSKVEKTASCWNWIGHVTASGYGQYGQGLRRTYTHRWIYEYTYGIRLGDLHIHHKCKNRKCVNPEHLQAMTQGKHSRLELTGRRTTHCQRGHEFTENTTYTSPKGIRRCKLCANESCYEYRVREGLA